MRTPSQSRQAPQKTFGLGNYSAAAGDEFNDTALGPNCSAVRPSFAREHFTELERQMPAISPRMLVKVLRELESHGLVRREVHSAVPPRVDYSLTSTGQSVAPLIGALRAWGTQHRAAMPHAPEPG